ncbi:NDR1/HIN1-like protein 6 [Cynara cardunculus var. scolymus]|uniref:Late embryogenesis abundant protein, LEA-14 n=1 Tax=Cynara cardunculus var. scolymus TaxID=59895 RepID=A0A118JVC7_CYNCS|nr:NDR1/HIN1-like protein 6 [Cynara cardunculus var. scolymus]KVH93461.1 Late embryogenesis abundant protein, LEA-14 [Cynara cardunculus var. scolymus]
MTSDSDINGRPHHIIRPPPPSSSNYRPHYYPHSSSSSSSASASIKGCCCCLILLFSFLALLVVAVVLVIFLAVKPKKPEFNLQQVGVQYINLAATNPPTTNVNSPSSASLSLAIRMLFTAKNENKVGIKYEESTFNIMYRGIPLGRGTVPGFFQPAHSIRQVQTTVSVDRVNLLQADATDLVRDASLNDRVELRIMGDVRAKIRIIGLTSPAVQVSIDCGIVISPRKQSLTYKQCGFDGLQL